jgi:hypothetical protein
MEFSKNRESDDVAYRGCSDNWRVMVGTHGCKFRLTVLKG